MSAAAVYVPSAQQTAFFDWIDRDQGNCVLIAVAGAGKTTTVVRGIGRMRGAVFFGAFNRAAAKDAAVKAAELGVVRPNVSISTMHSAGFKALWKIFPHAKVDEHKVARIVDALVTETRATDPARALRIEQAKSFTTKLVSFAKQYLIGSKSPIELWLELVEHFSLDEELPETTDLTAAVEVARSVFFRSAQACREVIDFDDMIWAPLAYRAKFTQYDWVIIDEAQDTNPARRVLTQRLLKPTGRFVAVGDPAQSIYGFTGATSDAMDVIKATFHCRELPLTVTYRCPRAVVTHVQQWVSHIQAHPDAPEGVVREVLPFPADCKVTDRWFTHDRPVNTDAVICRYTAPLISTAYAMLKAGVPCQVEGRQIGSGLVALARRWKVRSLDALENRLEDYRARETRRAEEKKNERRVHDLEDRIAALQVFIERCRERGENTIDALVREIETLFADQVDGVVTLATGHRSKGREWPRVYWLERANRRQELKPWEEQQETNLKYVIGTRAQAELVLVPEVVWDVKDEPKKRAA